MDVIIVKIKCNPNYAFLNKLRDQGLLFDAIRNALMVDEKAVQEISDDEYELFENFESENDKD